MKQNGFGIFGVNVVCHLEIPTLMHVLPSFVVEFCWQDMNLTKKELEQVGRSRWEEKGGPLILQIHIIIYYLIYSNIYNVDELKILILQCDGDYYIAIFLQWLICDGFPIALNLPGTCYCHSAWKVGHKLSHKNQSEVACWVCWVLRLQLVQRSMTSYTTSYHIWWRTMCYQVLYIWFTHWL